MMSESLFEKIGVTVFKTDLTRKITLDGITSALPVYRIKLSELFYNDKNDRIATSIDAYNRQHTTPLMPGKNEEYNQVIENFIVKSNEQAIFRTKNNIRVVGQREAGVVLPDGRVIDGNRRFTCLRQLAHEDEKFTYFEAIILPKDADSKQIKLLELMIQHGEEQRVGYDPVDMIVGMYHDIIETNMLTVAEYAQAIDVTERDVTTKLKMAEIFIDFLEFLNMPKHWYLIKEFNIYAASSNSTNVETILRRCDDKYRDDLKTILYTNIALDTSGKYVDIASKLITSDLITTYIRHARPLASEFKKQLDEIPHTTFDELKNLIQIHVDIKRELKQLLEESFLRHKKNEVHSQPSKNVSKAISMIKSIDDGVIQHLTEKESTEFKQNVAKLLEHVNQYTEILDLPPTAQPSLSKPAIPITPAVKKTLTINLSKILQPVAVTPMVISSLCQSIAFQTASPCVAYFIDVNGQQLSNKYPVSCSESVTFEFNASTSSLDICYLIIQHPSAAEGEVSQVIPFEIKMNFTSRFDF
jgi:hypothetical protein